MGVNLKERFNERKWLPLVVGLMLFAAGAMAAIWLKASNAERIDAPVMEAVKTEKASRKVSETIAEARKERDRLPEVVRNAKEQAAESVGSDGDADIARRWNGLLGRYRGHRTPPGGL